MAQALFRAADIPRRLMPASIALGTSTFTMTAFPGTPAIQNAIPMPFFGTTPFAAPGLGVIASAIMLGSGLWWLARCEAAARRGEGLQRWVMFLRASPDQIIRSGDDGGQPDPARSASGRRVRAASADRYRLPALVTVVSVNLPTSPSFAASRLFLRAEPRGRHPATGGRRCLVGGGGVKPLRSLPVTQAGQPNRDPTAGSRWRTCYDSTVDSES
jgi:hypothetical protein